MPRAVGLLTRLLPARSKERLPPDEPSFQPSSPPTVAGAARSSRRTRLLVFLGPTSPAPIYAGLVLVAAGFAVIAFTWGKVAGLTAVALQLPFLVSGGVAGLGLVMVGITVVNVAAKRRDAADRARQMERLSGILSELREVLGGEADRSRDDKR